LASIALPGLRKVQLLLMTEAERVRKPQAIELALSQARG